MPQMDWKGKHFSYFQNKECEYFPCHKGMKQEDFNCLFCYCPLYALGETCGGEPVYTEDGKKDCTKCTFPHHKANYGYIIEQLEKKAAMQGKQERNKH